MPARPRRALPVGGIGLASGYGISSVLLSSMLNTLWECRDGCSDMLRKIQALSETCGDNLE